MGMAARIGDMTAHGGSMVVGTRQSLSAECLRHVWVICMYAPWSHRAHRQSRIWVALSLSAVPVSSSAKSLLHGRVIWLSARGLQIQ